MIEYYDPKGIINTFFRKTWQTDYTHKSLGKLKRYRNVNDIDQIKEINRDLVAKEKLLQMITKKKKRGLQEDNTIAKIHPSIILKGKSLDSICASTNLTFCEVEMRAVWSICYFYYPIGIDY